MLRRLFAEHGAQMDGRHLALLWSGLGLGLGLGVGVGLGFGFGFGLGLAAPLLGLRAREAE